MDLNELLQKMKEARADDPVFQLAKAEADKVNNPTQPLPGPPPEEDPIPYDEEAGTLTNIGRFMANNLAKDQFGGAFPAVGSVKMLSKTINPVVKGQALLKATGSNLDKAKTFANAIADAAESGLASATDVARTQNAMSRATDFAQRNANQIAAARKAVLNKMKSR